MYESNEVLKALSSDTIVYRVFFTTIIGFVTWPPYIQCRYQARTQDSEKGGSNCGTRRSQMRGSGADEFLIYHNLKVP